MDTTTAPLHFFDSHGALWATCSPSASGAEAFGPRGAARRIDAASVGIALTDGETDWTAAERAGLVVRGADDAEFDTIHPAYIAVFFAAAGDVVVISPPSLRRYLNGDDGTADRRAAEEGARARASTALSVTVADVAAVNSLPAPSGGSEWVIVFPTAPEWAALLAAGHEPRLSDETDRAMAARGFTTYTAADL